MKTLKTLLFAFAITVSSATFANTVDLGPRSSKVSAEIQQMLADSDLLIEEPFSVSVIFKVTEDKKIEIRSISSPNEQVNDFLKKRLDGRQLHGTQWDADKVYALPVKVESRR